MKNTREIKFRYWDELHKVMMDWAGLKTQKHIEFLKNAQPAVMQFTGLFDKNGQEMYEGDVVKYLQFYPFEIIFGKYEWLLRNHIEERDFYSVNNNEIEIIGNIYSNPDLIK